MRTTSSAGNPDCSCAATNKDGTQCLRNAQYGQVCWQHAFPDTPIREPGDRVPFERWESTDE